MGNMSKRQQAKFDQLLEGFAKVNNASLEELKEEADIGSMYTYDDYYYEGQTVINFFKFRIQPHLNKGEDPVKFDKRYREWRIRVCEGCEEEFAYAYTYDGVKFCSLECLDVALHEIGMQVTRGRSVDKRWGEFFRPAILPSSALQSLKQLYGSDAADAFVQSE